MSMMLLFACVETIPVESTRVEASQIEPSIVDSMQLKEVQTRTEQIDLVAEQPSSIVEVIPQSAWGLSPSLDNCRSHTISKISIHHSATLTESNASVPKHLQSYQRFHQKQGWFDIAYHFAIDLEGNVYQGRSTDCAGDTFTSYTPDGHLLIMLDGNFEQQKPTTEAWSSLVQMVSWGLQEYDIDSTQISVHKDLAATACPGKYLAEQIASELISSITTDPVQLVILEQDAGRSRVQQILQ